jgi:HD-GYP domain-containing protein (c-di-GMP phosphodiesterase class II)
MNPPEKTVLLVGTGSALQGLAAELVARGLRVAGVNERDSVMRALAEHRAGAAVLPFTGDRVADTTLLLRAIEAEPRLAVILFGGSQTADDVAHFLRLGAVACLEEKSAPAAIAGAVIEALARRTRLLAEDRQGMDLRASLRELHAQIEHQAEAVRHRWVASLEALVRLGEANNLHFAGHSLRVADMAGAVAVAMGLSDGEVESTRLAGRLHDLGMIGVPARILGKAGPLDPWEFEIVKRHPIIACEILDVYPDFGATTRAIRGHHERWDGSGYPDGLAGEAIPLMARILAAVEIFDALTEPRPYKRAEDVHSALERIRSLAGSVLDPAVCEALAVVVTDHRTLPFLADTSHPSVEVPETLQFQERGVA